MVKRVLAVLLLAAMLLGLPACGDRAQTAQPADTALPAESMAVSHSPLPQTAADEELWTSVEAMRDPVGALMVFCLQKDLESWTPALDEFNYDDAHLILCIFVNHHYRSELPVSAEDPPFTLGIEELHMAARAMFPDFTGTIPGEEDPDPYYQWYWIWPVGNDRFSFAVGNEGEWAGALRSVERGEDGTVTAQFAVVDYSDLIDTDLCTVTMLPDPDGAFGYTIQQISIEKLPVQSPVG